MAAVSDPVKWCTHCRSPTHDDWECCSTRLCTCNRRSYPDPHEPHCGIPIPFRYDARPSPETEGEIL